MEFGKKLYELRKQKGLTQEELAEILYVSRTAISKWESGRGFPNIESLKSISKYFSVSLDQLISGEEILEIAGSDSKEKQNHLRDLIFGLLDIGMSIFFFMPLFGQKSGEIIREVSLVSLENIHPIIKLTYFITIIALILFGILTLGLQNCESVFWTGNKNKISLILSAIGVVLFILSRQPYAAILIFTFLIVKALVLIKRG